MIYYIKTKNINVDRRAQKEWRSLTLCGESINLIYCSDVDAEPRPEWASSSKVSILGGAAASNIFLRLMGASVFSISSMVRSFRFRRDRKHWVNDPVLFLLVILLSVFRNNFIIWDHHELPPCWILKYKTTKFLFKLAYQRSDIVIHANNQRKNFLENELSFAHGESIVLGNFPLKSEVQELQSVKLNEVSLDDYIYLQNCIGENRCDLEIFRAVKAAGLKAVHAGGIDPKRLRWLTNELGGLEFCEFVGVRSIPEINYLLKNSICTLIFYKNVSMNNWLCEPNKLYQAVAQNCTIIGGNNPPIVNFLSNYENSILCFTDGSNSADILDAVLSLQGLRNKPLIERMGSSSFYWECYDELFKKIV